jgi:cell division protein FtsL
MDPESIAGGGIVACVVLGLRLAERYQEKRSVNGSTSKIDTRIALAEQQLTELKEDISKLTDKVVENLKLTYELREKQIVAQAVNDALKKGNSQHDSGG